ncbi:alpha/beta hydrolase [Catellatospora sp. NPDC049609]|uniref:alpha/beta hydrolase n=1 Tax=Catellatospora sp. NPDC049609 TaxID=3155505 RepID=UPI003425ACC2
MRHPQPNIADARWPADPDRVAIVLPGGGYTPARPLLHLARNVLFGHGWTVQELWWAPPTTDEDERAAWALAQATAAVEAESARRVLLVGKSLGTFAAPLAATRDLPAIWFTPLLFRADVVDALAAASAPTLLLGGGGDWSWDPRLADDLGLPYLELPGADHGLEHPDDPVRTAENLVRVTRRVNEFAAAL